jgi:dipeptidyl aminopeptidase/acylaminoacyl peptidase
LAGYPSPRATKIDPTSGAVITQVTGSPLVWSGMPTVDLRDSARIAFAGQWIGSQTDYNQDRNYIWLADDAWQIDRGVAPVRPLDLQANAKGAFRPEFQGRAPWFSPDGRWVAFESARADPKGELYAIFIQSAQGDGPARQVTDIKWNANHAKFYPDGQRLVATLLQEPGGERRGIVMLDVGEFVSEASSAFGR